jgi:hypothetical protein
VPKSRAPVVCAAERAMTSRYHNVASVSRGAAVSTERRDDSPESSRNGDARRLIVCCAWMGGTIFLLVGQKDGRVSVEMTKPNGRRQIIPDFRDEAKAYLVTRRPGATAVQWCTRSEV